MGTIKKIKESNLIGGTGEGDVYPVTSTKAIFNEKNENLDSLLFKLLSSSLKTINLTKGTNDYSELDNYNSYNHLGIYLLYRIQEPVLIGRLNVYASWGGTIVQELESFKLSTNNTAIFNTTKMVRYKYNDDNSWSEWKPYQSSFIGSSNVDSGIWSEEEAAPSLKEFREAFNISNVLEWSGIIVSGVNISISPLPSEAIYINPPTAADIFFDDVKKSFCVLYEGTYYVITSLSSDFQETIGNSAANWSAKLKKNYFKGLNNITWVAVSDNEIKPIIDSIYIMPSNIKTILDRLDRGEYPSISSSEVKTLCGGKRFFDAVESNKLIMSADGIVFNIQGIDKGANSTQVSISCNYPFNAPKSITIQQAFVSPDSPESEWFYSISFSESYKLYTGIYVIPGDIDTMNYESDLNALFGNAREFSIACNNGSLFKDSKGRTFKVERIDSNTMDISCVWTEIGNPIFSFWSDFYNDGNSWNGIADIDRYKIAMQDV